MVEEVATQETQETKTQEKPEYVPEKFWNKDLNEVNVEELSASYNSLEKKLGARTDELSKQVREDIEKEKRAKVPENYEITKPELEEGVDVDINADMPLLQWWQKTAKDNGLTQEQFNEGINMYLEQISEIIPTVDGEKKKLGENADARIESVSLFANKYFDENTLPIVQSVASTADGIKMLEYIQEKSKDMQISSNDSVTSVTNEDELKQLMLSEEYWNRSKRNPEVVKKVEDGYKRLYK